MIKFNSILTAALLLTAQMVLGQANRGVYMLHGYPGGQGSLEVGANYLRQNAPIPGFDGTRWPQIVHVGVVDYDNGGGVLFDAWSVSAKIFNAKLRDPAMSNARTIAFGSSYGGLVARQIAINERNTALGQVSFGGVISHNSPNLGAPIAGNIDFVLDWNETFVQAMVEPFLQEGAESIPVLGDVPAFRVASRIVSGPLRGLANLTPGTSRFTASVIADGVDFFARKNANTQSTRDMAPGSAVIQGFTTFDAEVGVQRQLTFAVEEEQDLFYRMLSGPLQAMPAIVGTFGGNDDLLVQPLIGMEGLLATRRELWTTLAADANRLGIVEGRLRTRRRVNAIRDAYVTAARELSNADERYKRLAGFLVVQPTGQPTTGTCWCIDEGGDHTRTNLYINNREDCLAAFDECYDPFWIPDRPTGTTPPRYVPNDGIVPVESQQAFTQEFQIAMPGDNHFSSNNSTEYRNALDRIFDGRSNDWFECN